MKDARKKRIQTHAHKKGREKEKTPEKAEEVARKQVQEKEAKRKRR